MKKKGLRFLRVSPLYIPVSKAVTLAGRSYENCLNQYYNLYPPYGNALEKSFQEIGWASASIIHDWLAVQKKWYKENNLKGSKDFSLKKILIDQIKSYKPNLILFQGDCPLNEAEIRFIKEQLNNNIVFAIHSGFFLEKLNKEINFLFSASPLVNYVHQCFGWNTRLLYHYAYNELTNKLFFSKKEFSKRPLNFIFCGTIKDNVQNNYHYRDRMKLLIDVCEKTNIKIFSKTKNNQRKKPYFYKNSFPKYIIKQYLSMLPLRARLLLMKIPYAPMRFKIIIKNSFLYSKETAKTLNSEKALFQKFSHCCFRKKTGSGYKKLLSSSKLLLNKHVGCCGMSIGNLRMFEAAQNGCVLLNEDAQNINDLFKPEFEILTYKNFADILDHINKIKNNKIDLAAIAERAFYAIKSKHSASNRRDQILSYIYNK